MNQDDPPRVPAPGAEEEFAGFFHGPAERARLRDRKAAEERASEVAAQLASRPQALEDLKDAQATPAPDALDEPIRPVDVASERAEHHEAVVPAKLQADATGPDLPSVHVQVQAAPPQNDTTDESLDPADAVELGEPLRALPEAASRTDKTALGMQRHPDLVQAVAQAKVAHLYKDAPRTIHNTARLDVVSSDAPAVQVTDAAVAEVLRKSIGGRTERHLPAAGPEEIESPPPTHAVEPAPSAAPPPRKSRAVWLLLAVGALGLGLVIVWRELGPAAANGSASGVPSAPGASATRTSSTIDATRSGSVSTASYMETATTTGSEGASAASGGASSSSSPSSEASATVSGSTGTSSGPPLSGTKSSTTAPPVRSASVRPPVSAPPPAMTPSTATPTVSTTTGFIFKKKDSVP